MADDLKRNQFLQGGRMPALKLGVRLFVLVIGIVSFGCCAAFANTLSSKEMLKKIDKITRTCAQSYSRDYAEKFIALGGKVTNSRGTFGISIKLNELLVPAFSEFLRPGQKFIDMGSGDGRVVFLASLFGVDAYGIEYDKTLHAISMEARKRLSKGTIDPQKVHFIQGDFFDHDISGYDVLYCNFGNVDNKLIAEKIDREAAPDTILIMYWVPDVLEFKNFHLLDTKIPYRNIKSNFRVFQKSSSPENGIKKSAV